MNKREFLKLSLTAAIPALIPKPLMAMVNTKKKLKTAHNGVGGMGAAELETIASHPNVDVVVLCDV